MSQVSVATFEKAQQAGVNEALLPVLGGAMTGMVAVAYPEILYAGFTNVNSILQVQSRVWGSGVCAVAAIRVLVR